MGEWAGSLNIFGSFQDSWGMFSHSIIWLSDDYWSPNLDLQEVMKSLASMSAISRLFGSMRSLKLTHFCDYYQNSAAKSWQINKGANVRYPWILFSIDLQGRQTLGSLMRQILQVDAICFAEEQALVWWMWMREDLQATRVKRVTLRWGAWPRIGKQH